MEIKIISPNDLEFDARAKEIVDIYNSESKAPFSEALDVTNPKSIKLIYVVGCAGGVITDAWHHKNGDFAFHSVMFAAFPVSERRKGYLRACLERADYPIETVQVNGNDPIEIWKKLGFTKQGTLGFSTMLRSRDFDGIKWGVWI